MRKTLSANLTDNGCDRCPVANNKLHIVRTYIIQIKDILALYYLSDIRVFDRIAITIYNAGSDWPRTFLQPGCFCLGLVYVIITIHI